MESKLQKAPPTSSQCLRASDFVEMLRIRSAGQPGCSEVAASLQRVGDSRLEQMREDNTRQSPRAGTRQRSLLEGTRASQANVNTGNLYAGSSQVAFPGKSNWLNAVKWHLCTI